jgi:hypothetical protein
MSIGDLERLIKGGEAEKFGLMTKSVVTGF